MDNKPHLLPLEQIRPVLLNKETRFVLLETQRFDRKNYLSYLFLEPAATITCYNLNAAPGVFRRLEKFLKKGYWAAGFFSYELGYGFERFGAKRRYRFPLIWLGIFNRPLIFDHRKGKFAECPSGFLASHKSVQASILKGKADYRLKNVRLNESLSEYVRNIRRVRNYIGRGLTYQVNYTLKCKFGFEGSDFALYKNLRNTQPVAYAGFIRDRRFSLLSFSPELFFRKQGRLITVRPMKGTISRGRNRKEDKLQMSRLKASLKDRSENVMIVDLMRNDLGRISEVDSVRVTRLYEIERYKTLFQMTSTIQAQLKRGLSLYEFFRSIFPSGSVTGAPKIKTMQIIKELEKEERGVYTGAIGFFKPNKDAVFNVAIRTVLLGRSWGEMGIGSGIVYDSDPVKEYEECKLKALFLTSLDSGGRCPGANAKKEANKIIRKNREFKLIETMRWSRGTGYLLLPYHLERLKSSAAYFNFPFDEKKVRRKLKKISKRFDSRSPYRVRLLLSSSGDARISCRRIKLSRQNGQPRITFSPERTNSRRIFLFHKTTSRKLYDREFRRAREDGFFDVIFENERGEITEGAISNIFIRKNDIYYTPPVKCGLLGGVYRRYFMEKRAPFVRERILRRSDLLRADAIYLTNAVRGIIRVRLS